MFKRLLIWGSAGLILGLFAVYGGLLKARESGNLITAGEFRVVDAQGNLRAAFGMKTDGSPQIVFADAQGKPHAFLA